MRLRPGNTAPGFSLVNEKGEKISLHDFKCKVVYLDFWGVGYGPCIYEIKEHLPSFYDKYKNRDFIILNFCVDTNTEKWRKALLKYKPKGINLIAEGWTDHPVCQAYFVNGIPHNVLIDKNGKIANNNAPRSGELMNEGPNMIDKLLK
jgi:peroxiredoxin